MSVATEKKPGLVGSSAPRIEDERMLRGQGSFVADLRRPGMLEAVFVRSPVAHARIVSVDAEAARAMPGVVAVITGEELSLETEPQRLAIQVENFSSPAFRPLATDKVRFVGDPVALIVAVDRASGEDARDVVDVEYEPLEPIITAKDAQDVSLPAIFEEIGSNVAGEETICEGDPDAAFAQADAVVRMTYRLARTSHAPLDGRAGLAEYDARSRDLIYHSATRHPNAVRSELSATLRHPIDRTHVVIPDIGGAFGQKNYAAREDIAVCFAARKLGRPVRWIEDRGENLMTATQGRGESFDVAAAVKADGTILALDVRAILDQGAYPAAFPIRLVARLTRVVMPNAYRIDHLRWRETDIVTNRASFGVLRGPWSGETLMRETIIDAIARELSIDPVEIRRRNLVTLEEQPRTMPSGATLEGVSAHGCLARAVEAIGYDDLRDEQSRARAEGRLLGIGFASFVEPGPGPPDYGAAIGIKMAPEHAVARLELDGRLTILSGQAPHGQGHETTVGQVAADALGVPIGAVRVVFGDTRVTPFSAHGTRGSRGASLGAGAAREAVLLLRHKLLALAGSLLSVEPDELEIGGDAVVSRFDPSVRLGLAELGRASYFTTPDGEEPGLRSSVSYRQGAGGWSGGTHVCVVEVDPETGGVSILRYLVVEECGRMINPAIVDGQIRGSVAMGLGIALLEDSGYDEDGNPSGTLMDYLLPTSMEVPPIEIIHFDSEPLHESDFRGVGEGGTIGAPPAVINAIADAIGGISAIQLPLTPNRILDLIDAQQGLPK